MISSGVARSRPQGWRRVTVHSPVSNASPRAMSCLQKSARSCARPSAPDPELDAFEEEPVARPVRRARNLFGPRFREAPLCGFQLLEEGLARGNWLALVAGPGRDLHRPSPRREVPIELVLRRRTHEPLDADLPLQRVPVKNSCGPVVLTQGAALSAPAVREEHHEATHGIVAPTQHDTGGEHARGVDRRECHRARIALNALLVRLTDPARKQRKRRVGQGVGQRGIVWNVAIAHGTRAVYLWDPGRGHWCQLPTCCRFFTELGDGP